jgi:RimK family alpha-L-glutamate ligase
LSRRIALFANDADLHVRGLLRAFATRGVEASAVRLAACTFDTSRTTGLAIPGFDEALPDAVLVREVGGGSFEEVTRRLGLLHALRELGVPVWNDARAIERCVDKSMTSFLLARAGIPTPSTWAVEGTEAAYAIAARELPSGPLVIKPLFGSQGRGLRLVETLSDLPCAADVAGVYYLQRYVRTGEGAFADHRLFVCGGAVIAGMTRRADGWITNIKRGAAPVALIPDAELTALALAATRAVGADYAGVDLLRGPDGAAMVIEVNSMPAWRGLQRVAPVRIAEQLTASFLAATE